MFKYALMLLLLASNLAHADLIKPDDTQNWTVSGLAHYVRSKEDKYFSANIVSWGNNSSVVAFVDANGFCYASDKNKLKTVKVKYQWVKFIQKCSSSTAFWLPQSQRGIEFVKQSFSGNSDVTISFDSKTYTFSTKKYTSVRQRWERTQSTLGDAL
ncbi:MULTISPECIES: hypothetical protein [Vibrio]|uniref:hypothetical protein n=1 Tax=Vibrio TaxID=662 RepID=UPI0003002920|nr:MULTISPECIES: hypothetical protein [Vibrio]MDE3898548.1 hypothetical protein [Vibrio sp. CC007]PAU35470.1 hypothetical protein CKF94_25110 [Vibrio coralliilyticus]